MTARKKPGRKKLPAKERLIESARVKIRNRKKKLALLAKEFQAARSGIQAEIDEEREVLKALGAKE